MEVNERQSATFECEVSFDNAIVSWYKDTWELTECPKYNFTSQGRRHFMVIRNVTIEDEGVEGPAVFSFWFVSGPCFSDLSLNNVFIN